MNITSIWSLILTTSSLQMSIFYNAGKQADLNLTLKELEPYYGLPAISRYDYIVVGGGAAGCLIAGKLSESGFSVLLLEKGGDPPPPIMSQVIGNVRSNPNVNEFYKFTPQENNLAEQFKSASQGVMLGGSSAHNFLRYHRGSPEVYDEWADIVGDPSLSYRSMLLYYKEIEDVRGFLFNEHERTEFYGTGGPFSVETDIPVSFGNWFEAGKLLGYKAADPNAHLETSFTTLPTGTRNATRETSCIAYIFRPPNPSIRIMRFSYAWKILTENGAAVGILYFRHGITQVSQIEKEVIVTAGPIGTPVLLIRSGIGPLNTLVDATIPVVLDLPGVGAFIQNHASVTLRYRQHGVAKVDDKQLVSFLSSFPGGKGATGFVGIQAMTRSSVSPWTGGWPDTQILFDVNALDPSEAFFYVTNYRPKSTGSLWFNTSALSLNELDSTKIVKLNPSHFHDPDDIEVTIQGIEFVVNGLLQTPQFKARKLTFIDNLGEKCKQFVQLSREFWTCYVKGTAWSNGHWVGTAKMGREGDVMRVVDSEFRVVGLRNLRIADSSVIPKIPNGNTQAPILALAAKAVHFIVS